METGLKVSSGRKIGGGEEGEMVQFYVEVAIDDKNVVSVPVSSQTHCYSIWLCNCSMPLSDYCNIFNSSRIRHWLLRALNTEVVILLCVLQYPERVYRTASGVMCLDFSKAHPNLLAVSFHQ